MKICNKCNFNNDENATFCSKCGTKLITKQKKDIFNILSIISIVLFIVIILANVIIYPLSLRDDESSGMFWFLGVFLPSIPLFFGSIILSIISIVSYFRNIIKKSHVQTKKTILVVLNIVQLILTISFIFSIPKLLVYIDSYNENFENKDNISNNDETLEDGKIDFEKYLTLVNQTNDLSNYEINLYQIIKDMNLTEKLDSLEEDNIKLDFNINDYNVQLTLKNEIYDRVVGFDLYVGDKFILSDGLAIDDNKNLSINLLGNYLIYKTSFATDIKSLAMIIIDKSINVTKLYELENVKGMTPRNIKLTDAGIVFEADRITHGPSIEYDIPYMIMSQEDCQTILNHISKDLIVKATYTYEYKNGILNLNPTISEQLTFENYISHDDTVCMSN